MKPVAYHAPCSTSRERLVSLNGEDYVVSSDSDPTLLSHFLGTFLGVLEPEHYCIQDLKLVKNHQAGDMYLDGTCVDHDDPPTTDFFTQQLVQAYERAYIYQKPRISLVNLPEEERFDTIMRGFTTCRAEKVVVDDEEKLIISPIGPSPETHTSSLAQKCVIPAHTRCHDGFNIFKKYHPVKPTYYVDPGMLEVVTPYGVPSRHQLFPSVERADEDVAKIWLNGTGVWMECELRSAFTALKLELEKGVELPEGMSFRDSRSGPNHFTTKQFATVVAGDELGDRPRSASAILPKLQPVSKLKVRTVMAGGAGNLIYQRTFNFGTLSKFKSLSKDPSSPFCVGVDKDTSDVYNKIKGFVNAEKGFCSDFASCDRTESCFLRCLISAFLFRGDSFWVDIMNDVFDTLWYNEVFTSPGGVSSGDPFTSIVNSCYTYICYYVYKCRMLLCKGDSRAFHMYNSGKLLELETNEKQWLIFSDDGVAYDPDFTPEAWAGFVTQACGFKPDIKKSFVSKHPEFIGCEIMEGRLIPQEERFISSLIHTSCKTTPQLVETWLGVLTSNAGIYIINPNLYVDVYNYVCSFAEKEGVESMLLPFTLDDLIQKVLQPLEPPVQPEGSSASCIFCARPGISTCVSCPSNYTMCHFCCAHHCKANNHTPHFGLKCFCGNTSDLRFSGAIKCGDCSPHAPSLSLLYTGSRPLCCSDAELKMAEGFVDYKTYVSHVIFCMNVDTINNSKELTLEVSEMKVVNYQAVKGSRIRIRGVPCVISKEGEIISKSCFKNGTYKCRIESMDYHICFRNLFANAPHSRLIVGPPGTGKTYHIIHHLLEGTRWLLAATNNCSDEHASECNKEGIGFTTLRPALTTHGEFVQPLEPGPLTICTAHCFPRQPGTIVVDECSLLLPQLMASILSCGPVTMVGDPHQLSAVIPGLQLKFCLPHIPDVKQLNVCYRFGQNLVDAIQDHYDKITSVAKPTCIHFTKKPVSKGHVMCCYNHELPKLPGAVTVDCSQGLTVPVASVNIWQNNKFTSNSARAIVAATRCTKVLYVFDPEGALKAANVNLEEYCAGHCVQPESTTPKLKPVYLDFEFACAVPGDPSVPRKGNCRNVPVYVGIASDAQISTFVIQPAQFDPSTKVRPNKGFEIDFYRWKNTPILERHSSTHEFLLSIAEREVVVWSTSDLPELNKYKTTSAPCAYVGGELRKQCRAQSIGNCDAGPRCREHAKGLKTAVFSTRYIPSGLNLSDTHKLHCPENHGLAHNPMCDAIMTACIDGGEILNHELVNGRLRKIVKKPILHSIVPSAVPGSCYTTTPFMCQNCYKAKMKSKPENSCPLPLPRVCKNLGYDFTDEYSDELITIDPKFRNVLPIVTTSTPTANCLHVSTQNLLGSLPYDGGYVVGPSTFISDETTLYLREFVDGKLIPLPPSLFSTGRIATNSREPLECEKGIELPGHTIKGEVKGRSIGGCHHITSPFLPKEIPDSTVALVGISTTAGAIKKTCTVVDIKLNQWKAAIGEVKISKVIPIRIDFMNVRFMVWENVTAYPIQAESCSEKDQVINAAVRASNKLTFLFKPTFYVDNGEKPYNNETVVLTTNPVWLRRDVPVVIIASEFGGPPSKIDLYNAVRVTQTYRIYIYCCLEKIWGPRDAYMCNIKCPPVKYWSSCNFAPRVLVQEKARKLLSIDMIKELVRDTPCIPNIFHPLEK
ncbi:TSHSV-HP4 [Trionyx sinensis hemorrhagic syndrome virus]|uniref:Replicase polyprotein 1ab n=1 Tax=Trionyx sinensis hemorrhagic syndrome virus TaxID=1705352 RepID=A0AAE7M326_9NIDO|nr:TSHSV-HP4 [Trionyx sinensis hemorrhagic syndrome virus]QNI38735.1 TSHSV-HP4 [Trionyx sinensis hemorrhagic syndrome virus]